MLTDICIRRIPHCLGRLMMTDHTYGFCSCIRQYLLSIRPNGKQAVSRYCLMHVTLVTVEPIFIITMATILRSSSTIQFKNPLLGTAPSSLGTAPSSLRTVNKSMRMLSSILSFNRVNITELAVSSIVVDSPNNSENEQAGQ